MCGIEMKNYVKKLLLLVSCTLMLFTVRAQTGATPIEDMVNAMKTNRVADMAKYFDTFVRQSNAVFCTRTDASVHRGDDDISTLYGIASGFYLFGGRVVL